MEKEGGHGASPEELFEWILQEKRRGVTPDLESIARRHPGFAEELKELLPAMELLVRGGVAGGRLPSTAASTAAVRRGDVVALATDGLRLEFTNGVSYGLPPQQLAERLLAQYQTARDDALVE